MKPVAAVVLAAVFGVLSSCGSAPAPQTTGYHGSEIAGLYRLPTTRLVDTTGAARSMATPGKRSIVFFGYSQCPDVCSGIIADITTARKRLDPALAQGFEIVVVTTDPARDTPAVWGKYLARFDPSVIGLTGPLDDIVAAASTVGVEVTRGKQLPSGGYAVDHGTQVYVFNVDGSSALVWTTGTAIGDMKEDLERLGKKNG